MSDDSPLAEALIQGDEQGLISPTRPTAIRLSENGPSYASSSSGATYHRVRLAHISEGNPPVPELPLVGEDCAVLAHQRARSGWDQLDDVLLHIPRWEDGGEVVCGARSVGEREAYPGPSSSAGTSDRRKDSVIDVYDRPVNSKVRRPN